MYEDGAPELRYPLTSPLVLCNRLHKCLAFKQVLEVLNFCVEYKERIITKYKTY